MKKTFLIIIALFFASTVYAGSGLTRGDQLISGQKTFEHNATFSKDVTILGALLGVSQYSTLFYVDSNTGHDSSGNYGKSYLKPFATLEYAIGQTTANKGDIIFVMPGHNEGISAAAAIDLDVAGISVVGLGNGSNMPTIDFDHADASVAIGADNVLVQNIRFRVSANAVTVGLDIEDGADYASVLDCEFGYAETATDEFAIALRTNDASNNALIEGNAFHAGAQAAVTAIKFAKDTDGTVVKDNWITGTYSTAPVLGITTASTNLLITGNSFFTAGAADTFNLAAASTGIVSENFITMNAVSAALALDIGNALSFNNHVIADDDVGGTKASILTGAANSVTASADD